MLGFTELQSSPHILRKEREDDSYFVARVLVDFIFLPEIVAEVV